MILTRETVLEEAKKCVMQDRNKDYGSPEDNFKVIGKYWTDFLGKEITATDVSVMMLLMKIARLHTSPTKGDHWIDIAGYAACGGEIATSQPKVV